MSHEVKTGDCRELMREMPADSVDAVVCDPPYGLEFMGKEWDRLIHRHDDHSLRSEGRTALKFQTPTPRYQAGAEAQAWHESWATEALRILKPGAYLLAFGGTRTYHRLACAVEDAGFEIRDSILWLYGQGFPKSKNIGNGQGTALKPAHEPIVVARKPLAESSVAANVEKWGTGAINVDACRIEGRPRTTHAEGNVRGREIFGGGLQVGVVESGAAGRWPANVVIDDLVAPLIDEQSGECGDWMKGRQSGSRRTGNVYGEHKPSEFIGHKDSGGASRFFYCAKASRSEREAGLQSRTPRNVNDGRETSIDNPYQRGDTQRLNTHPTVKPVELMRWLCRLVTPPNGLILDPFCGSGTTGVAAVREGFNFLGMEQDAEHAEIARQRIAAECERYPLLAQTPHTRTEGLDLFSPVSPPAAGDAGAGRPRV